MDNGPYTTYSSRPGRDPRRRRRQRARRRLALFIVAVLAIAAIAAAVILVRGGGDEEAAADKPAGTAAVADPSPTPTEPPPEVWVASRADPVRIWVGGDSMGGELGWALEPVLKARKVFKPITYYKESSGICRYDFFDWGKQIESVSKSVKPDAAVIMMGTNDTQSVWDDGEWISYGKSAWKKAYERRVGEIMDTMLDGGAKRVYWVGMPIMGEGWRNSRMRLINKVFAKQAEKRPGATYVDVWDLYADEDGAFIASLRLGDGVHFTVEGQEMLADYVYKAIKADWLPPGSETPSPSPSATPSASSTSI
jgi:hypothetical protein